MEVMLATGIFAMVGVALAVALNETISAAIRMQRETRILWSLESKMNEARLGRMIVGKETLPKDGDGVTYEKEVSMLDLKTEKQEQLAAMYNLKITARWKEHGRDMDLESQIYVYQP